MKVHHLALGALLAVAASASQAATVTFTFDKAEQATLTLGHDQLFSPLGEKVLKDYVARLTSWETNDEHLKPGTLTAAIKYAAATPAEAARIRQIIGEGKNPKWRPAVVGGLDAGTVPANTLQLRMAPGVSPHVLGHQFFDSVVHAAALENPPAQKVSFQYSVQREFSKSYIEGHAKWIAREMQEKGGKAPQVAINTSIDPNAASDVISLQQ